MSQKTLWPLGLGAVVVALIVVGLSLASRGGPSSDGGAELGNRGAGLFDLPGSGSPPPGAEPLPSGDVGIDTAIDGRAQGALRVSGMRCERGSLLVVDTSEGVFYAAVPRFGDWGCDQALEQWRGVTPPDARVGLRYVEPPEGPALTLINDRGGSQVLMVSGAWRKPAPGTG